VKSVSDPFSGPYYGYLVNPLTSYGYDTAGNEITQTDAIGNLTKFGYDQYGNQVRQTLPDGEIESWTYNVNSQVTGHTDFDGNTAAYTYATSGPHAGLLQQVVYAGAGKATQNVTYGYNDLNQQQTVTDASGTTTDSYDDFGNLIESQTPEGTIWYVFDPATGNHTQTYTANTNAYYTYDLQGRLTKMKVIALNGQSLYGALWTRYTYDPAGNKLSESDPNGDLIAYAYDALNRLTGETITDGSTTLFSEQFTLNDNGTRASATESQLQPGGSTLTSSTGWTYDALQRLTGESATFSDPSLSYGNAYTFDLANNRMSSAHTGPGGGANETITYAYNGDDELTSQTSSLSGNTTNTYDANGSLTTSTAGGVTTTYAYDARNKMVGYSSGSMVAAYVYDDAGNRVQETVNGVTTYYLTDTQNPTGYAQPLEAKSSPTATPSTTYFLGDRVFAQADGSGTVTYLLPDGHGSTAQVADSSGNITAVFQYDAFGTALNFTPNTAGTVFLFGGDAVYDPASGTYLHGDGVRPRNGFLFIQRDSYSGKNTAPLTLQKYDYASADPVMMLDPSGHDSEYYTSTNGISAHILFSAYVTTLGFTPHLVGPDATRGDHYYDLKPITHIGDGLAQMADAIQMEGYQGDWGTPGQSTDIVTDGIPTVIGHILGDDGTVFKVTLYVQNDPTKPSGLPGTGIVLYSLTPDGIPVGFPVPEVVPAPSLRPILLQPQSQQFDSPIADSYDYQTLVGLGAVGALGCLGIGLIGAYGVADAGASTAGATLTGALGGV
jgi:YD repeat-containing protein